MSTAHGISNVQENRQAHLLPLAEPATRLRIRPWQAVEGQEAEGIQGRTAPGSRRVSSIRPWIRLPRALPSTRCEGPHRRCHLAPIAASPLRIGPNVGPRVWKRTIRLRLTSAKSSPLSQVFKSIRIRQRVPKEINVQSESITVATLDDVMMHLSGYTPDCHR